MLNNLQAVFAHAGRERDLYAMQELQELLDETCSPDCAGGTEFFTRSSKMYGRRPYRAVEFR